MRNHKRGIHTIIEERELNKASKLNKKKNIAIKGDGVNEPFNASIDFPRPLRISSNDGTIEDVRKILRKNMIGHKTFDPALDS